MPSGYTCYLKDGMDPIEWLRRIVPRAMGMCIAIRDESFDLSVKVIESKLALGDSYHQRAIDKASAEYQERRGWGEDEWAAFASEAHVAAKKYFTERTAENEAIAKRYAQALDLLSDVDIPFGIDDVIRNSVEFARKQISESKNFDLYTIHLAPEVSWGEAKNTELKRLEKELAYHSEEATKCRERDTLRLTAWRQWQKFVDDLAKKRELK